MTVEPGSVEVTEDGTAVLAFRQVPRRLGMDADAGVWNGVVEDLATRGARRVVLDWSAVGHAESSDCGLLLAAVQRLRRHGIPAAVVSRVGRVRDVWRLVRLDKAVPMFDTRAAAVDHLRGGAGTTGPEAR